MNRITAPLLGLAALALPASAQLSETLLQPSVSEADAHFGYRVAVDGDTIVAGSGGALSPPADRAFVFERAGSGWSEVLELDPVDFGLPAGSISIDDLAIAGDTLITVGGESLLYQRVGGVGGIWQPQFTFEARGFNAPASGGMSADRIAVTNLQSGVGVGVDVYERSGSTWAFDEFLLQYPVPIADNPSATAIALSGDRMLTGHGLIDSPSNVNDVGDATVYRRDATGWVFEQQLVPSVLPGSGEYGRAVDIQGDTAVVCGWKQAATGLTRAGRVHVFERTGTTWTQTQDLTSSTPTFNERFGARVVLSGNRLVVTAPRNDEANLLDDTWDNGAIYVFERQATGFVEVQRFVASDATQGDRMGEDGLAFDDSTIVAGTWRRDDPVNDAGVAHVFEIDPDFTVYCTGKPSSAGCVPQIGADGTPSATLSEPFSIAASDVINTKNGLLFYGFTGPSNLPFQGGTLCVAPPLRRAPLQNSGGSPPPTNDCSGTFAFDFNAWTQSGIDPLLAIGQQIDAQYWFRDPPSTAGSGLTNAVDFTIQL